MDLTEPARLLVSAIGGGAFGAWLQGRNQERVEQQRQRERAAELVGVASRLQLDTAPRRVALQVQQANTEEPLRQLTLRHDEVRTQLWTLEAWHRSPGVRQFAHRLFELMVASLDSTVTYVQGCAHKENFTLQEGLEAAMLDHGEASRLLGDFTRAVERG